MFLQLISKIAGVFVSDTVVVLVCCNGQDV